MLMAMVILGLVFGIALSVTIALFAVLSMEGGFRDNLLAVSHHTLRRLTGRVPKTVPGSTAGRQLEAETRLRAMTEEAKVLHRLVDQTRVERDQLKIEIQAIAKAREQLQLDAQVRDARIAELVASLQTESGRVVHLREEAGSLAAEIARLRTEVRDLQMELNVAQSGVDLTGASR